MKIMVSAGELSGDVHGAHLVKELKTLRPDLTFFGLGSDQLKSAGVDVRLDITPHGTIGIFEALPNLFPVYFAFQKMVQWLKRDRPALVILIDSQGINFPLAQAARKLGIKTVYYIAPQEWLWGTPRGVKKVADWVDLIIAIFEKEYQTYRQAGARVVYFGHPLLDLAKPSFVKNTFLKRRSAPVISLCPGSRTQEIKNIFPLLLQAGQLVRAQLPSAQFLLPVPSLAILERLFPLVQGFPLNAIVNQTADALAASDLAICTSGTINLEASILGVPNIMVYKLSPLTYFVGKYILKIDQKLKFFSMPNILLNRLIVPELTMSQATPQNIAAAALALWRQPPDPADFKALRQALGQSGVIRRVAQAILSML